LYMTYVQCKSVAGRRHMGGGTEAAVRAAPNLSPGGQLRPLCSLISQPVLPRHRHHGAHAFPDSLRPEPRALFEALLKGDADKVRRLLQDSAGRLHTTGRPA
jgi:hypothetical protein